MALEPGNAVQGTGLAGAIADARKKAYRGKYDPRKDKGIDAEAEAIANYINENVEVEAENVKTSSGRSVEEDIDELAADSWSRDSAEPPVGTETVDSFDPDGNGAAIWHYYIEKGSNMRGGTIGAVWNYSAGVAVPWQNESQDIGDTSDVTLDVVMDAETGKLELKATTASDGWTVRVIRSATI